MTPCSPSHSQHRIHTMAIASRRHQTRAAGSTAVKIQELLPECGHTPQRFFDLDKFSELREHARIIVFHAKARHRVGDAFLVPIRQLLLHLRAAIRDVHGSATCRPTRRHDLLEWCTATAPSMHGQELLFHFAGHFETCDKGSLCALSWWTSPHRCLLSWSFLRARAQGRDGHRGIWSNSCRVWPLLHLRPTKETPEASSSRLMSSCDQLVNHRVETKSMGYEEMHEDKSHASNIQCERGSPTQARGVRNQVD